MRVKDLQITQNESDAMQDLSYKEWLRDNAMDNKDANLHMLNNATYKSMPSIHSLPKEPLNTLSYIKHPQGA